MPNVKKPVRREGLEVNTKPLEALNRRDSGQGTGDIIGDAAGASVYFSDGDIGRRNRLVATPVQSCVRSVMWGELHSPFG